jgi:plastocyanin
VRRVNVVDMQLPMNTTTRRRVAIGAACLITAIGLSACGDDETAEDVPAATTAAAEDPTEDPTEEPTGETIVVTAVDYRFEGLPETVPAGTKLSLVNEGGEPHELVAMRIPDDETRSIEELIKLPEEELGAIFGAGEPATVILAATGQTDLPGAVVGDGTLSEPGRYAVVCFLPVGSDDSILESDGPPQGEAPPHAIHGMVAEVTVVG